MIKKKKCQILYCPSYSYHYTSRYPSPTRFIPFIRGTLSIRCFRFTVGSEPPRDFVCDSCGVRVSRRGPLDKGGWMTNVINWNIYFSVETSGAPCPGTTRRLVRQTPRSRCRRRPSDTLVTGDRRSFHAYKTDNGKRWRFRWRQNRPRIIRFLTETRKSYRI